MLSLAFVVLQYIVSAKAGFVNVVDGATNVYLHQQVSEGAQIETYARGHVELLLTPGSFLRIGENSTAVFDSTNLTNVAIRLVDGSAIIESAESSKRVPIQVTAGTLKVSIAAPGVYRFSPGSARVLDGKLQVVGSPLAIKKGHEVTALGNSYAENSVPVAFADDLDHWNEARSELVARANTLAYRSQPRLVSSNSMWYFSPMLTGFTFIPVRSYRSYYGYSFVPVSSFRPVPPPPRRSPPPAPTNTGTATASSGGRANPTVSRPAIAGTHSSSRVGRTSGSKGSAHR